MSAQLLTIRKFAELSDCDEKQVRRAIKAGKLKPDGEGRLSEDLLTTVWRRPIRTSKSIADTSNVSAQSVRTKVSAPNVRTADVLEEDTPAQAAAKIIVAFGAEHNYAEALRIKENYNAGLKQLEYEQKSGTLVRLDLAQAVLFEEFRNARDSWLNWPARVGPLIAAKFGLEADSVTEELTVHVHTQIADLGEPVGDFERRES